MLGTIAYSPSGSIASSPRYSRVPPEKSDSPLLPTVTACRPPSTSSFIPCSYLYNLYYCITSTFHSFFFASPQSWSGFLFHFEGWSVIFKSIIGTGINIWTFSHTGLSLPYAITASIITGTALFIYRGKNALVNKHIFSGQRSVKQDKRCSFLSCLYGIFKYNAAVGVGLIDYVSACVSLINILALLSGSSIDKITTNNPFVWFSVVASIFIPYQFLKFRVALMDRGADKFIDNIKRSPCSTREDKHTKCTYFSFLFITLFNTIYFAILNAFLGSSTLRKFCLLLGITPFWRLFDWSDSHFDMLIGLYAALSGIIVTLSNSSAELAPSARRQEEICKNINQRCSVKAFLTTTILDAIANMVLVYLVSYNSPLIKDLPAKTYLAAFLCLARIIPYVMQNFSKVINNFGKFKEALDNVFDKQSVQLINNGHLIICQEQLHELCENGFSQRQDRKTKQYSYPVTKDLVEFILKEHETKSALNAEEKSAFDNEDPSRSSSFCSLG